jgi:hypothetical protein
LLCPLSQWVHWKWNAPPNASLAASSIFLWLSVHYILRQVFKSRISEDVVDSTVVAMIVMFCDSIQSFLLKEVLWLAIAAMVLAGFSY